jgi:hypothetical protein
VIQLALVRARILFFCEILIVVALVLVTRCANYRDVFAGGQIYLVDADCYARMTRARICYEHPGIVVRHHDFENFPAGTSPHTTAPLDYLIVGLAALATPFSRNALDLAGAIVSPFIAVGLGIFLCWWTRRMSMRFRFCLLILYAVSPILVHGTALGRPDHQSLLIGLIAVALCAEWTPGILEDRVPRDQASQSSALQQSTRCWNLVCGVSWALALWVSLYEPSILLALVLLTALVTKRRIMSPVKWICFVALCTLALLIERRFPAWPGREVSRALQNWGSAIGELSRVPINSRIWFEWCGWLLLFTPILFWRKLRSATPFLIVLLLATFALTLVQARWGYFFALIFALLVPEILSNVTKAARGDARAPTSARSPARGAFALGYVVFAISLFPVVQAWDKSLSDEMAVTKAENQTEQMKLRAIASEIDGPFLAPWWFSPALAYWSRQPAVAGSSHESLSGIVDCASFYSATEQNLAADICRQRQVKWVLSYDSDRLAENSARVLARPVSQDALCYVLDRHPSAAPLFLKLVRQTARFKLYRVEGL